MQSQKLKYDRAYNFSAGPCQLPIETLEEAHRQFFNVRGYGTSALEISHRSKTFLQIQKQAKDNLRAFLDIPSNYEIMFLNGGGYAQNQAVPMNLYNPSKKVANYLVTGKWGQASVSQAKKIISTKCAFDPTKKFYTSVPPSSQWDWDKNASYFHYTRNETIGGIEFIDFPFDMVNEYMPVVCDQSSDIGSVVQDYSKFGVVYGGAQKNIGPAGVTIVIVRKDLINPKTEHPMLPAFLSYSKNSKAPGQLFNTCSTFSIFVLGLNLAHMNKLGLKHFQDLALKRSKLVYDVIDMSNGFYSAPVRKDVRSRTNVTFNIIGNYNIFSYNYIIDKNLEAKFVKEGADRGLLELKGHRSIGGIRASMYNGMQLSGAQTLATFMKEFMDTNAKKARL